MKTLFWGNLVFFFFFLLHFIVWKIKLPARQTRGLLLVLFGGLAASLAAFGLFPSLSLLGVPAPAGLPENLAVALYVSSLILAYMITYSAIEADSPTLVMIRTIADAGEDGMAKEDLLAALNNGVLIEPRLRDLLTDRMAALVGGKYALTPKGRLFARLFTAHRRLLGLGKGG
ncbi:MAG: hypothetical protein HY550_00550 [Elusimicrobia bacterium]|nr:hypothetical protein [Elusimicrobiota bacterium]